MLCAYTRPRYQVSVYRTIGPLVLHMHKAGFLMSQLNSYQLDSFSNMSF